MKITFAWRKKGAFFLMTLLSLVQNSFMQQLLANDKSASLLSLPIHRMIDELELEIRNQKQDEVRRLLDGDDDVLDLDEDPSSGSNERLWVDKYRPKNYTDLMGDEV